MCNIIDQADKAAIREICNNGLPYFIRTELSNTAIFSDALRDFQKKFWTEIQGIWRNPTPAQESGRGCSWWRRRARASRT